MSRLQEWLTSIEAQGLLESFEGFAITWKAMERQ